MSLFIHWPCGVKQQSDLYYGKIHVSTLEALIDQQLR